MKGNGSTPMRIAHVAVGMGSLLLAGSLVWAQYGDQPGAGDPPSRVARVAVLEGNVSLEPAGVNAFSAAEINYPLTAGDRIYADNASLTELQTSGLALRLGNGADLTVTSLTDAVAQFGLAQGSVRLRTRDLYAPEGGQAVVEIDTPNGAVLVERAGDIRVDSYPQDDTTVVTVSSGQVEVTGNGFDQQLGANQSLRLAGNPTYVEAVSLLAPDALDQFDMNRERERQQSLAVSAQYADPGMIGLADLAQYGDWTPAGGNDAGGDGDYGAVWYPRYVPAGWTPYSNGHWAWVAPWGWTWVEAEPWGFAPFHYGRWASFNGRWGWVPGPPPEAFGNAGPRRIYPVYSPALVAFVGGPSFSISLGFGGGSGAGVTAWFPLGPHETYTPWYHASPGYVNRVNVTNIYTRNVTEVHNTYINRTNVVYNTSNTYINRPAATVAVTQHDFAAGRSVAQAQPIRFSQAQRQMLSSAPVLPHPLVTPAMTIAAPQAPARVVPPSVARPVLEGRGGFQGQPGGRVAPVGNSPMVPASAARTPTAASQPGSSQPPTQTQRPGQGYGQPQSGPGRGFGQPQTGTQAGPQPARGAFPVQRAPAAATTQPAAPAAPVTRTPPVPATAAPARPVATQPVPAAPATTQPAPYRGGQMQGRPTMSAPMQMPAAAVPTPAAPVQARPVPRPPDSPRALVNRTPPQPAAPSFADQQKAIQRTDPGRPLGPQQLENLRGNRPAGPASQPEPVAHPAPAVPASKPNRPPPPAKAGTPGAPPPPAQTHP